MTNLVLITIIAGQRVAFDATRVEAVLNLAQIVPVPLAPAHVRGLTAARSRVLTVVDAAAAVGFPAVSAEGRAVVVDVGGHAYALCVDAVLDAVSPIGDIKPFDPCVCPRWAGVASGTVDTSEGFAVLVDPQHLITGFSEAA